MLVPRRRFGRTDPPGYQVRRRTWASEPRPGALSDRQVLVTGGTSGIGKATARRCAELGATVHVLSHNSGRLEQAVADLRSASAGTSFVGHVCDVGDLDAVRAFATAFRDEVGGLHALLHNAGTMAPSRTESRQGHELTLATHVLGPFLMTDLLAPVLAPQARVVFMHPGCVNTSGVATFLPKFRAITLPLMRSPGQGADTLVWLAAAAEPTMVTGQFWHDRKVRPTSYYGWNETSAAHRRRLWEYCHAATTG